MVTDDLQLPEDLALDPTTAPLAGKATPLPPGNWEIVVKKYDRVKLDKNGYPQLKTVKGRTYQQALLTSFQVVSPFPYDKKVVYPFQPILTVPQQRQGKFYTQLYDLLLAYDQTKGVSGVEEGLDLAVQYVASEQPIRVHTTLEAVDMDYVRSFDGREQTKEEKNEMWTKARMNVREFISPTGQVLHSVTGPSGNLIEPRCVINVFYPSEAKVKLGPDSER